MNREDKKEYAEYLEDICSDYCEPKKYCILKEFLVSSHPSPRLLTQIKCIDKKKFELGKEFNREVKWAEAMELWVEKGYAKKFADYYDEDIKFNVLYKKIMNGNK